jgi:hypothetical protein
MSRVVVCGSLNMDVVVESVRRPHAGETLLGAKVSFLPGGKGLNQAVAAARLGMAAAMAGAIGHDAFGNTLRGFLADNDVDSSGVRALKGHSTGLALIQVAGGDNAITVASGANLRFTSAMVRDRPRAGRGLGRAVRDAARDDARPADAGASRRRPHGAQPGAVRAPSCPLAEMRRCRRLERDRARPGDRRQGARREQPAPRRRGLARSCGSAAPGR